jgi:hypothetical protein
MLAAEQKARPQHIYSQTFQQAGLKEEEDDPLLDLDKI